MHLRSLSRSALGATFVLVALTLSDSLTAPLAALADDDAGPAPAAVARLSVVDGSVTIARGDAAAPAVAAAANARIREADYVTTGQQSRAEIRFDRTTAMRLGENVQLRVSRIAADDRQVQLAAGTIDVRVVRVTGAPIAIDTPSISIVPRTPGSYRVAVSDDGTTFVTVRAGRADVELPHGTEPLLPGRTLVAEGTAAAPQISDRDAIAYDSFDAFNAERDRTLLGFGTVPPTYARPFDAPPPAPSIPSYAYRAYVQPAPIYVQPVPLYVRVYRY